jgi:hypothetical protein
VKITINSYYLTHFTLFINAFLNKCNRDENRVVKQKTSGDMNLSNNCYLLLIVEQTTVFPSRLFSVEFGAEATPIVFQQPK